MGVEILIGLTMAWGVIEGTPYVAGWLMEREQRIEQEEQLRAEAELDEIVRTSGHLVIEVKTMEEVEQEENARLLELGQRERRVITK
mgnify:FL=1